MIQLTAIHWLEFSVYASRRRVLRALLVLSHGTDSVSSVNRGGLISDMVYVLVDK